MDRCEECGKIQWKPTLDLWLSRVLRKFRLESAVAEQVAIIRIPPWPKFCDGPPYTQKDPVE